MGYESKLYIVDKHDRKFINEKMGRSDGTALWALKNQKWLNIKME